MKEKNHWSRSNETCSGTVLDEGVVTIDVIPIKVGTSILVTQRPMSPLCKGLRQYMLGPLCYSSPALFSQGEYANGFYLNNSQFLPLPSCGTLE
jgi:hypothetical protein